MTKHTWLVTSLLVDIYSFSQFRNQDSPHMGCFSETRSEECNSWVTGRVCHLLARQIALNPLLSIAAYLPTLGLVRPSHAVGRGVRGASPGGVHVSWAPARQPPFPAFPACGFLFWGLSVQVLCSGFVVLLS